MKKYGKNLGMYVIIISFILIGVSLSTLINPTQDEVPYTYSTMISQLENDEISRIDIIKDSETSSTARAKVYVETEPVPEEETTSSGVFAMKPAPPEYKIIEILDVTAFMTLIDPYIVSNGIEVNTYTHRTSWIVSAIPIMITISLAIFILIFLMNQMGGGSGSSGGGAGRAMSFGKTKAKLYVSGENNLRFDQVAGLDEEKAELEEVVEFLKEPKKFIDLGAKIPKGVLLVGPPGTGKTYLAKAVAGESGVPFFSISGSDFVEMFVGVGASRVRDLFAQAKKNLPCIIFIDEIDAVGRRRGSGQGGSNDEREQTLNQLLVEMDGFGANEGIIIIAATNRQDVLDPALLRPGRFDRQIMVNVPDIKGREEVLKIHTKGKVIADDIDLSVIARTTSGFTPADLANLLNEAALLTARHGKKEIDMEEVRKAFIKMAVGTEKRARVTSEKDKKITAYHEAGHALLHELLDETTPTYIISIISTGNAGGYTMPMPSEDKLYYSKKFMEESIITFMGGRVAEAIIMKDITTGASNDIERATSMARSMVTKYGMSDILGPIQFGDEDGGFYPGQTIYNRNYGEEIALTIDKEVSKIMTEAYNIAERLILEHIEILHKIAQLLLEKEKITGKEVRDLFPPNLLKKEIEEDIMITSSDEINIKKEIKDEKNEETNKNEEINKEEETNNKDSNE